MDGFLIDNKGDVVVQDNEIQMVSDTDLISQTVRQVLKTNLGEWWLNEEEGIDFSCFLCKKPNYDQIEDNINIGLRQVDNTLTLTSIDFQTKEDRTLVINFSATNDSGEIINITL